jgi:hypothetical protein
MQTGDVVPLFQGKRRARSIKRDAARSLLNRAWARLTGFAATIAEIARESRALEKRLLDQNGHRRFVDR